MSDLSPGFHPQYRELADEVARVREELAHLLTAEHELREIVKPNLLAQYQQKIGAWELRRLQAQVAAMRAKRRLELAQAAVNRGQAPAWAEIDQLLQTEFLRWQQLVQESASRLHAAEHRTLLAPEEDRELKKLYYALVKVLHPDLHPHLADDPRHLWQRTQEAYERRDLVELRALLMLAQAQAQAQAQEQGTATAEPQAQETLRRDLETLRKQITEMVQRMEQMESLPPFTLRSQLGDDAWVTARRSELDAEIAHFEMQLAAYERPLAMLQNLPPHGPEFNHN